MPLTARRATPFRYQEAGIALIDHFEGRALLADEQGLGKTLQALWRLSRNPETMPAVVVCPAAVKYVWEHEAAVHCGLRAAVCEGRTPPAIAARRFSRGAKLVVVNYDILQYWLPYLLSLEPQTVILDEGQALAHIGTARTNAARLLVSQVPNVQVLSGTPLMNRPSDLWPILNMVRPDLYPSFWEFAVAHCKPERKPWGKWEYKGAENIPALHAKLKEEMLIRRLKKDVLKDLPEKVYRVVPCPLTDPAEYAAAIADFRGWLKRQGASRGAQRAAALVKGGYLLRLTGRLKLRAVCRWANQFLAETDEKLVLFAHHKKFIAALRRRVDAPAVVVDGTVTGRLRKAAVDQFQHDPKTRLFIGETTAAGVGTTLTAASTVGICELGWVPGHYTQAADRVHRHGQKSVAFINFLVALGTYEEDLCELLQEKQGVISGVLDGGPTGDTADVFDRLLEAIQKKAGGFVAGTGAGRR